MGLLFAKTVYQELEVDTEMQHGLLPGCLALAAKFVPTMKQVSTSRVFSVYCVYLFSFVICTLHCQSCTTSVKALVCICMVVVSILEIPGIGRNMG